MQPSSLSNQQSPTTPGPPSPTFVATSTLLENGVLKTIDIPGHNPSPPPDTDHHQQHPSVDSTGSVVPSSPEWENDSLAVFHFALYTLRPGRPDEVDGTYDDPEYEMPTEDGIPEEEEIIVEQNYEESGDSHYIHDNGNDDDNDDDDNSHNSSNHHSNNSHNNSNNNGNDPTPTSPNTVRHPIEPGSPDTRSDRDGSPGLNDDGPNRTGTPPTSGDESVTDGDTNNESTTTHPRVIVRRLVRDTRLTASGQPFELRMGRKFVAVGLELAVKSMQVGEQSRFLLTRESTEGFAKLEQALRQRDASHAHHSNHSSRRGSRRGSLQDTNANTHNPPPSTGHTFGATSSSPPPPTPTLGGCLHNHHHQSLSLPLTPNMVAMLRDLQTLPLELHVHLLEHRSPDQTGATLFGAGSDSVVNRPWWFWSPAERTRQAVVLRQTGNMHYEAGQWREAASQYEMCLALLEDLPNYPQNTFVLTEDEEVESLKDQGEKKEKYTDNNHNNDNHNFEEKKDEGDEGEGDEKKTREEEEEEEENGETEEEEIPLESPKDLRHACHLNLAACHLKLQNYTRCITHCDTAISLRPTSAKAHYRRAMARIARGDDLIRAREDLERARQLMADELRLRSHQAHHDVCDRDVDWQSSDLPGADTGTTSDTLASTLVTVNDVKDLRPLGSPSIVARRVELRCAFDQLRQAEQAETNRARRLFSRTLL